MFLIVNLILVIAAGLMVLVVAATASMPRSAVTRDLARVVRQRGPIATD